MSGLEATLQLALGAFRLDVAVEVPAAGVTAVVGPSGSGKSTLLRCIAGFEPHARGRIAFGSEVWLDSVRGTVVPPHRRGAALVFQDANLLSHLTVRGNLDYALRRARRGPSAATLDDAVSGMKLAPLLDRRPDRLSGGERQRVAIARALLSAPRLLLLDEPLAALDPAARAEVQELLRQVLTRAPAPVLYVTHARTEALHLAESVIVMEAGAVRASGPIREVALRPEALAFGGRDQVGAVIEAEVAAVDERFGLSELRLGEGSLFVTGVLRVGERRRLEVLARDVSLCLDPPGRTSILNVLPARVLEIREDDSPQPVILVEAHGAKLLARISRRSLEALALAPGTAVYAQVKAVALLA